MKRERKEPSFQYREECSSAVAQVWSMVLTAKGW
jgi:hypothetical protein